MFFFWFSNYWYFCQISSSSYYFHHSYVFVWNMLHPIVDRNHHTKIGLHQLLFENSNLDLLRYGITVPSWFQIVTDRYWTSAVRFFWPWFLFGTSKFHKQISVCFPFLENMDVFWHLKKKPPRRVPSMSIHVNPCWEIRWWLGTGGLMIVGEL